MEYDVHKHLQSMIKPKKKTVTVHNKQKIFVMYD